MDNSVKTILEAAIRAPSGDNLQPWQIRISKDEIDILPADGIDGSLYNTGNQGSCFSLGAFVENSIIAARHVGVEIDRQFGKNGEIRLLLKENTTSLNNDTKNEAYYSAIFKRVTNRNPYHKKPLTSDQESSLQDAVKNADAEGIRFVFREAPQIELTQSISLNEQLLFENQRMHDDFFDTLSWDGTHTNKLPISALALPLPGLLAFKLARTWQRQQILNKIGFAKMMPAQTAALYQAAGGYGALVAQDIGTESYFDAGRTMQRIWLKATEHDLAIQPITGIVLLRHALTKNPHVPFTDSQKERIARGYESIKQEFGINEGEILFVFRIGHPKKTALLAPRKALSDFIK